MLAVNQDWWNELAAPALALTAVIVFIKVFTSWKPFLWVLKRLAVDPVESKLEQVIEHQLVPLISEWRELHAGVALSIDSNRVSIDAVAEQVQAVNAEMYPNHGSSLRDAVNKLVEDGEHLRETTHSIATRLDVTNAWAEAISTKVDDHIIEDLSWFQQIIDLANARFGSVDEALEAVRALDAQVKHDLDRFNEDDALGREGSIDRRVAIRGELEAKLDEIQEQLATLNGLTVGQMADANEARRIQEIPEVDRTEAESRHIHDVQKDS